MAVQIQFRNDLAATWDSVNPTLAQGELGLEIDTGQFKVGTGSATWTALDYGGIVGPQGIQGVSGGITIDVTSPNGGVYIINGATNPTLSFIRGHRYVINVSAPGHPFWIQTVSGAYSAGNIYNTGVTNNGAENGTIIVEVAFDAPQLYYACQYHSSMQGSITVSNLGPQGETGPPGEEKFSGFLLLGA